MNPMLKYSLARLGLFVSVAAILLVLPIRIDIFLRLGIAVLISAGLSFFLLRRMRDDVSAHVATMMQKRAASKERLRSALAGDDDR